MRTPFLFLALSLFPALSQADGERVLLLSCPYKLMGTDFAKNDLGILANGEPEEYVTITHYGSSHREGITPQAPAPGEWLHFWISKDTKNEIEVIVFQESKKFGNSVMYNHSIPYGKEMWAACTTTPVRF